jgi:hypothetical protein
MACSCVAKGFSFSIDQENRYRDEVIPHETFAQGRVSFD